MERLKRILLTVIALLILFLPVALASQVCLTKKEARELWPRRHLYWYGPDHCWSNRRGPPRGLKITPEKPIINDDTNSKLKAALLAAAQEPTVEKKTDQWPVNAQPLKRLIDINPVAMSAPTEPVEAADLSGLPPTPPPRYASVLAILGGGFFAIILATVIWRFPNVTSGAVRIYQNAAVAGRKVLSARPLTRNFKSPVPEINIRDVIRRIDRGRHDHNPGPVPDRPGNPAAVSRAAIPADDSAIACWSRSLRAEKT